MLRASLLLVVCLLVCCASADQVALIAERDGRVYGPFETAREHRLDLDGGLYRLVSIRDAGNALAVRMQTVFIESIAVTNLGVSNVLELLSKQMQEKMDNIPGFVIDESQSSANSGQLSRAVTMNLSMVSCYDIIEYLAEIVGLVATYSSDANTIELRPTSKASSGRSVREQRSGVL